MIEKVSALIIRPAQNGAEILVFQHPRAGLQLPAGTVEAGESPEEAVVREAREETGLHKLTILEKLGVDRQYCAADQAILTQTMRCYAWPAHTAQRIGPLFTRGFQVSTFEKKVAFTHIHYVESDLNQTPHEKLWEVDGWLPSEYLTREVVRHFYLLACDQDTENSWPVTAEEGITFLLQWAGLQPRPELIAPQRDWLHYLGDRW